ALAGLLAALAMGCRVGTATLLVAAAVATLVEGRERWSPVARATALAAAGTALVYVPSVLEAGGLDFARNDFATSSLVVQVGRFLAKDLLLVGLPAAIALAVGLPAVVAVLRDWSSSWAVRFGLVGLVGSQLLFLRFPWKMAHLLPSLVCLAVLYAVALDRRPRILIAAVALQLLFAVVRLDVVRPDDPNDATGGRFGPTVTWGPVVQDWRCRRDHPDVHLGRQKADVEPAWDCAAPYPERP
ncbi:MAG: hypothetical protein KDA98_16245, partial [Acidimicrobiales bacterium]|nr:hypothetical protein [Acidimicrobiales bacterium]